MEQGNDLFDAGRYEDALASYQRALRIYRSPRLEFNIAEAHRQLGHWFMAEILYERFLEKVRPPPTSKIRQGIAARLEDMRARGGRIALAGEVSGVVIAIDGVEIGSPPSHPLLVRPGTHKIGASKGSHGSFETEVEVAALDVTSVEIQLGGRQAERERQAVAAAPEESVREDEAPAPAPQRGVGEAALEARLSSDPLGVRSIETSAPAPRASESSSIAGRWWFWAAIGLAVAGGVTAGALALKHSGSSSAEPPDATRFSQWQHF
jgi:PEGA domain-containing protein